MVNSSGDGREVVLQDGLSYDLQSGSHLFASSRKGFVEFGVIRLHDVEVRVCIKGSDADNWPRSSYMRRKELRLLILYDSLKNHQKMQISYFYGHC